MSSSGKLVTRASCGPGVHHLSLRVVNNTITLIKKESRHASQPVTEAARDLSHDLASIFWDCSSHGHFCLLGFTASPGQASTQRRGRGVRNGARGESVDGCTPESPTREKLGTGCSFRRPNRSGRSFWSSSPKAFGQLSIM